ncbi:MAG: SulP family sulfate permease [Motiliproteus sp.]|jgi:SulP family sulfate permease
MSHRRHLTQVKFGSALRECWREGYTRKSLSQDLIAGVTVGIIAIPLAMALAIASGVPPQHGLYTAIIAGLVIAVSGGSRFSVSGPTAAFVVILFPISEQFGLSGLLIASIMAGIMMVGMALARLGRLIEYIPEPVTLGFTAGIAVVIATLQLNDFLGLGITEMPENYLGKLSAIGASLNQIQAPNLLIGGATLATLLLWSRLRTSIPGHLPAVLLGVGLSLLAAQLGWSVDTIGSRFSFTLPDGSIGQGIPAILPEFAWPWDQPGPDGVAIDWTLERLFALLPAAFSIAMLGAIESLLCAVVLDGMSGKRHHSNGELLGQGVGNVITPFFGGITATAAIARSAANYKAGAVSPISSVTHALVVLVSVLVMAPWLAYIPMASMAALLLVVAWNMSEAHKAVDILRKAPTSDILVLLSCFGLTVLVDMVVAITFGVLLASVLFMKDIAGMTRVSDITAERKQVPEPLPEGWGVYKITGPLFFAAADRVFSELDLLAKGKRGIILYMDGVTILDVGGLSAMQKLMDAWGDQGIQVVVADLQFQPLRTVARAKIQPQPGRLLFSSTLAAALALAANPAPQSLPE